MLRNYLKIAVAVCLRRKYLTFVSLFGTVLTLTILVSAFAVVDSRLNPSGAQHRQSHILVVDQVSYRSEPRAWGGSPGFPFYDRYIRTLETPDKTSFSSTSTVTSYVDGRAITIGMRYTDAEYWEILDFSLLDGRLIAPDDVDRGHMVAVVNQATADAFFPAQSAIGGTIEIGAQTFEVIGVVANEPETSALAHSDFWVPMTTRAGSAWNSWMGGTAMLYVEDPSRRGAVQAEYHDSLLDFDYAEDPTGTRYDTAISRARTALEILAGDWLEGGGPPSGTNRTGQFVAAAIVVTLLFMALPAINLANLNVGRILERASEIGLRKATGASTRVLIGQFLFENVVLAALGGAIALVLTPALLNFLNTSVFSHGALQVNLNVFLAAWLFVLVFGVLSGAYPAWKMARLEPAAALGGRTHV